MKIIMSVLLLSASLFASGALSFADSVTLKAIVPKTPIYGIPKTGQVNSYHLANPSIHDKGDDGATQIGTPLSGPRFTANPNGTVTDNGTGLMWISNPWWLGTIGGYDWSQQPWNWNTSLLAIAALNLNNYLGHKDWRMPNILELQSLMVYTATSDGTPDSNFITNPFGIWQGLPFWTSTSLLHSFPPGNESPGTCAYVIFCNGYYGAGSLGYGSQVKLFWPGTGWTTRSGVKTTLANVYPVRGPDY